MVGKRFGYGVCTFKFLNFELGENVSVVVQGSNALELIVSGKCL